jgi:hypothetical protein
MQMKYSFVLILLKYVSLYQIWLHTCFSFRIKHAFINLDHVRGAQNRLIIRRSFTALLTSIRSKMPILIIQWKR